MMRRYQRVYRLGVVIVLAGFGTGLATETWAQSVSVQRVSTISSKGQTAIDTAARSTKYVYLYFWKDDSEQTRSTFALFQSAMGELAASADAASVNISDPNEKVVVDKFGVSRAPMPLVVAVAPNGAVTKAWPIRFTKEQLREGLVSRGTAQCMKALQDRKIVVLCVQNGQHSQAAMQGVYEFKADARFNTAAEIVTIDAHDQSEATFVKDLQIDRRTSQPVTVVLAPPGQPIARFTGRVTKDQLVAKVSAAKSGCCPGGQCGPDGKCSPGDQCAPGGQCCPGGKCGPQR